MNPNRINWGKPGVITLTTILTLALIIGGAKLIDDQTTTSPATVLTDRVIFPNGSVMEILGVGVGERTGEDRPSKKSIFSFFRKINTVGSTYFLGGDDRGLQISSETENSRLVRWRAFSKFPSTMLIEVRLKDRHGVSQQLPTHLRDGHIHKDPRIDKAPGGDFVEFKPPNEDVSQLCDAMKRSGLELLIQHRDPESGWIHLSGPYMLHENLSDRYILVLPAWRKDLPTLDFRAILPDGSMQEFTIPNPDFKFTPAVMTNMPLPLTHQGEDYLLSIQRVKRARIPGDHPLSTLEMKLKANTSSTTDPKPLPLGTAYEISAEDEWGNQVSFKSHSGAVLPASSKHLKLNLIIERSQDYPQHFRAGVSVLEGVVNPDGKSVDFKLLPDAARLGIHTAPVGVITTVKDYDHRGREIKNGALELQFEIAGDLTTDNLKAAEHRFGDFLKWQYLIFPDGCDHSVENKASGGSGGGGSSGGHSKFSRDVRFRGSSGILLPGAQFKVGVHGILPPDEVPLVLELPAEIEAE